MLQFAINLKTLILGPLWGLFAPKPQKKNYDKIVLPKFKP